MRRLPLGCLAALLALAALPARAAAPGEYRHNDGSARAYSILPPGQGRHPTLVEFMQFQQNGAQPAHNTDQLAMYESLVRGAPGLTDDQITTYFKDASFGVRPGDIERTYSPIPGLTVIRDRSFGVPHVYGTTRADTMFGAGYVNAEDRLFVMDVVRHLARGRLSEFLGASESNVALDRAQRAVADYTDAELEQMLQRVIARDPVLGARVLDDLEAYADGVNARINELLARPQDLPAEYPVLQRVPLPWSHLDSIALTTLVGGMFSPGGAGQLANDTWLRTLETQMGAEDARAIFDDIRFANDPEAPTTTDVAFPLNDAHPAADPDAVVRTDGPIGAGTAAASVIPTAADGPLGPITLFDHHLASNALLVDDERSATGNALAVFGPQVAYYSPQIVMEIDLHGPGIDARGLSFPGLGTAVLLGRGRTYGWSLTTAIGDHQDIRAVELCDPSRREITEDAVWYMNDGACVQMYSRTDTYLAAPSAGGIPSPSPDRIVVRWRHDRTRHGMVVARGRFRAKPVAFVRQRSTYGADADILLTYAAIQDPARVPTIGALRDAFARDFSLSFNVFLIHGDDIGFITAGRYPVLAPGVDPDLPFWGDSRWDWKRLLAPEELPQEINPARGYIVNWNNKQAPRFRAADSYSSFGPVHRTTLLRDGVERALAGDGKVSLAELISAMGVAATQDIRGVQNVPEILEVIGDVSDDEDLARATALLASWSANGAHRRDLDGDGNYDEAAAVALMDTFWLPLVRDIFGNALDDLPFTISNQPGPTGSAFATGLYGHVDKDLRAMLGRPVAAPFSRIYCGAGVLETCRARVRGALERTVAFLGQRYGVDPATWDAQEGRDQIRFSGVGVIGQRAMHWQNRPTFQHVLEFGS